MDNGTKGTLQTVERAFDVLELMAAAPDAQSLTQLSTELGRSKASIHRILVTLKNRGFLVQEAGTGSYRFGWACARLAAQAKLRVSLTEACLPAMRHLWRSTQETVYLAIYQSGQAVTVESIPSPRPVVATSVLGQALPFHAVSGALALLASRPDDEIERFLQRRLPRYTLRTITEPEKLRRIVRKIRRDGFAINREGYRPGVCGVAAPVRISPDGPVVAAMSVCMPGSRFDVSNVKDLTVKAAEQASRALAGSNEIEHSHVT